MGNVDIATAEKALSDALYLCLQGRSAVSLICLELPWRPRSSRDMIIHDVIVDYHIPSTLERSSGESTGQHPTPRCRPTLRQGARHDARGGRNWPTPGGEEHVRPASPAHGRPPIPHARRRADVVTSQRGSEDVRPFRTHDDDRRGAARAGAHSCHTRLIKTSKLYWSDVALALELGGGEPTGAHFENLILSDLLSWRNTLIKQPEILYWRTASGLEVDFVIEWRGELLPVEVKTTAHPSMRDAATLRRFGEEYPRTARGGVLLHTGHESFWLGERIVAVPWWRVL